MATNQNITRRGILKAGPAIAAGVAVPLAADAGDIDAALDYHIQEITRILAETAPDGSYVDGVCWRVEDDQPFGIWASGRQGSNRTNYRPEYGGWSVSELKFV